MYPLKKLLLILCLLPCFAYAQTPPIYSKIELTLGQEWSIQDLADLGIAIDHVHKNGSHTVDLVLDEKELSILENAAVDFQILVPDLAARYEQLWKESKNDFALTNCGLEHFDEGSMGAYHTYDDMIVHINLMQQEFPDLVKVMEVGKSVEDRTVYAVKMSDQVGTDESATEGVVYYDAITHAREPMGLETHLYYMWWLLENYGTDAEATYLLDHRELYFIPIVNPDGYVYNQTTNPNGGGFWRKNRRDNGGGCFGVDLNRNYSNEWGNLVGSSSDPCSGSYHGTSAFSEPESQNVRDFVAQIQPGIAFSCHTYSDVFLCPNSFNNELLNYKAYADHSSEFIPSGYKGYGTWEMMIGYFGAGTTQDYLNQEGIIAWTPEIGHEFWEAPSDICDRVQEMFGPMKYLSWAGGDYISLQNYEINNDLQLWNGDEMELVITIRNKGLRDSNAPIVIKATSPQTELEAIETSVTINGLQVQEQKDNSSQPLRFKIKDGAFEPGDAILIDLEIAQDGVAVVQKQLRFYAGTRTTLFSEDCENGIAQWGTGNTPWDTTFMDAFGGDHSIADSRYGNYMRNNTSFLWTEVPVDLSNTENPFVEFKAKWSFESGGDYVSFQISEDQINWKTLEGNYSVINSIGEAFYTGNRHWITERVYLSQYTDYKTAYFRWRLVSDFGVESDGLYFDDFEVVDYSKGINVGVNSIELPGTAALFPNPNNGQSELHFSIDRGQEVTWRILDLTGKVVLEKEQNFSAGSHRQLLNFPDRGVYFVELMTKGGTQTFKVLSF